jgi:hypothetical protein
VSHEFDHEPIPGLPANLPEGENILWQGSPSASATAWRVLHIGWVGAYFAALLAWRLVAGLSDGHTMMQIATDSIPLTVVAVSAIAILALLARLIARTTIYTITSRRLVMRFGVALPISVNLPFKAIRSAGAALRADGTGDVAIEVDDLGRLTYLHLWPHTRAWHVRKAQPSLRAVPDAQNVAALLSRALNAAAGSADKAVRPNAVPRPAEAQTAHGGASPAAA